MQPTVMLMKQCHPISYVLYVGIMLLVNTTEYVLVKAVKAFSSALFRKILNTFVWPTKIAL
jgi:hypothetical protein